MPDSCGRPLKLKPCACMSWTTASGEITPILVKVQNESGELEEIRNIEVLRTEKHEEYNRTMYVVHCRAPRGNMYQTFHLSYYTVTHKWEAW